MVKVDIFLTIIVYMKVNGLQMKYKERLNKKGTFKWPDGCVFIGEFNKSKKHGFGKMLYGP